MADIGNEGRCTKQVAKKGYSRKRKYHVNQWSKLRKKSSGSSKRQSVVTNEAKVTTISANKVQDGHVTEAEELPQGYRMIDISIIQDILGAVLYQNVRKRCCIL